MCVLLVFFFFYRTKKRFHRGMLCQNGTLLPMDTVSKIQFQDSHQPRPRGDSTKWCPSAVRQHVTEACERSEGILSQAPVGVLLVPSLWPCPALWSQVSFLACPLSCQPPLSQSPANGNVLTSPSRTAAHKPFCIYSKWSQAKEWVPVHREQSSVNKTLKLHFTEQTHKTIFIYYVLAALQVPSARHLKTCRDSVASKEENPTVLETQATASLGWNPPNHRTPEKLV